MGVGRVLDVKGGGSLREEVEKDWWWLWLWCFVWLGFGLWTN